MWVGSHSCLSNWWLSLKLSHSLNACLQYAKPARAADQQPGEWAEPNQSPLSTRQSTATEYCLIYSWQTGSGPLVTADRQQKKMLYQINELAKVASLVFPFATALSGCVSITYTLIYTCFVITNCSCSFFFTRLPSNELVESEPLTWRFWRKQRYIVVLLAFFGFFNVYSLRVNLSVAIVAMTENRTVTDADGNVSYEQDFPWDSKQKGLILSSFFYGYIMTQFLGGYIGTKVGGNIVSDIL